MARKPAKEVAITRLQKFQEKPLAMISKQMQGLGIDDKVIEFEASFGVLMMHVQNLEENVKKKTNGEAAAPGNGLMAPMAQVPQAAPSHSIEVNAAYAATLPSGHPANVVVDSFDPALNLFSCRYLDATGQAHAVNLAAAQLHQRVS